MWYFQATRHTQTKKHSLVTCVQKVFLPIMKLSLSNSFSASQVVRGGSEELQRIDLLKFRVMGDVTAVCISMKLSRFHFRVSFILYYYYFKIIFVGRYLNLSLFTFLPSLLRYMKVFLSIYFLFLFFVIWKCLSRYILPSFLRYMKVSLSIYSSFSSSLYEVSLSIYFFLLFFVIWKCSSRYILPSFLCYRKYSLLVPMQEELNWKTHVAVLLEIAEKNMNDLCQVDQSSQLFSFKEEVVNLFI